MGKIIKEIGMRKRFQFWPLKAKRRKGLRIIEVCQLLRISSKRDSQIKWQSFIPIGGSMKRKFKLLTSVASLCLAVALMAFGVYAAATPKVTISGTVSFNATNVFATVTVYAGTGAESGWDIVQTLTYDATQGEDAPTVQIPADKLKLTDTITTCGYKVVIRNDFTGDALLNIEIADTAPSPAEGWSFGEVGSEDLTGAGLAAGASHTWGRTFTVNPAAAAATGTHTVNCVVNINRVAE